MRILVDITHPAHFHFFKNAMTEWKARGHEVFVTTRNKDITLELLGKYGLKYFELAKSRITGMLGMGWELLERDWLLIRMVNRIKPDVMCAIGGIFVAHAGAFLQTPSLVFYDTEHARLQNILTYPFATRILTPDCYEGWVPRRKHVTYSGYHELAYTHPARFTPSPKVLDLFGLSLDEPFIVLRLVLWQATHDVRDKGITDPIEVVRELGKYGRVLISSERILPGPLESLRIKAGPEWMHHLLAFSRLFIGESATMASEAACLGTPAVFISTSTRGYTNEQETHYGLTFTFSDPKTCQSDGLQKAIEILDHVDSKAIWQEKKNRMLADKIDVTRFIVEAVEEAGYDYIA